MTIKLEQAYSVAFATSRESGITIFRAGSLNVDDGTREEESVMWSKVLIGDSSGLEVWTGELPMTFSQQGRVCRQGKRCTRAVF